MARDDAVGEDVVDIVADAELLNPVEIEGQGLVIRHDAIAVGIGIEDRPVAAGKLEPFGADADAQAAIEIAVPDGEAVARRNAFARLAIVGKADAPRSAALWA